MRRWRDAMNGHEQSTFFPLLIATLICLICYADALVITTVNNVIISLINVQVAVLNAVNVLLF